MKSVYYDLFSFTFVITTFVVVYRDKKVSAQQQKVGHFITLITLSTILLILSAFALFIYLHWVEICM